MDKFERLAYVLTHDCKNTTDGNYSRLPHPLVSANNGERSDFFRPLDFEHVLRWHASATDSDNDNNSNNWFSILDKDFFARFIGGRLSTEECRQIGFREQTKRPELIRRTVLEVAGTVLTAQLALRYGIAANLAGGTHHATPYHGAGYTILNDLAIATHALTTAFSSAVQRVLIIDCDVHQGDGTAKFAPLLKDKLFTLSLHCESNYPFKKANSTFDVGLKDGMEDDEYMKILKDSVEMAIEKVQPDLVLYDAGVDVYSGDSLGRLSISLDGIRRRDRWVLEYCVNEVGIPVAAVIGGGYDQDVTELARRHAILHEECSYVWRKYKMWEKIIQSDRRPLRLETGPEVLAENTENRKRRGQTLHLST